MSEALKYDGAKSIGGNSEDSSRILTDMSGGFDPEEARRLAGAKDSGKSEPLTDGARDTIDARVRVEKAFEKKRHKRENGLIAEDKPTKQVDGQSSIPARKTISSRYESRERPRVERIKEDLRFFSGINYRGGSIVSQPNIFVKAVRLIGDRLGIKTKKGEERREREAMHVALNEYQEEIKVRKRAAEERERIEAYKKKKKEVVAREEEKAKRKREEDLVVEEMARAMESLNRRRRERFRKQRIQEIVERDLSSRLLKVDNLEMEIISGNPEVQKHLVSFEGVDISVYDLKGIPFSLLSTTIDYKIGSEGKPGGLGTETFRRVLEDPSVWAQRRDEAEKESGFGAGKRNARGNTISTSYWNSERNIGGHVPGDLIYGFESVRADSIISIHDGDGMTGNMQGDGETELGDPDEIRHLETPSTNNASYNEVLLRRYSENGMPKKPDYIIVEDGRITEESLRHAKYFDIPILNIERLAYAEK